jgi:spermidine/putrescine transport system substrate-binding protein
MADPIRILTDAAGRDRLLNQLSRRRFMQVAAAGGAGIVLAACGGSDAKPEAAGSAAPGTSSAPGTSAAPGTAAAPGTVAGGTTAGSSGGKVNLYTWAEYSDPDLLKKFGNVTIDTFASNEEAITKMESAKGTAGYDLVVPTGPYVPQFISKGLIVKLDKSKLPNIANVDPIYLGQPWDKAGEYSVCKDWGTTGWIYDKTIVTTPITTWAEFNKAVMGAASGQTSVLDTAVNFPQLYFHANGVDWTTEDPAELDKAEKFLVDEIAQHLKAFDSYPGVNLASGNYALSQVWNGDARQGLIKVEEAGLDPANFVWGIGSPDTELWMDNWAVAANGPNPDGAHEFINFILDPANSLQDLQFHGYNTGVKGIKEMVPADTKYQDMIFFTDDQVSKMSAGAVNSATPRLVDILAKAKAKAGG